LVTTVDILSLTSVSSLTKHIAQRYITMLPDDVLAHQVLICQENAKLLTSSLYKLKEQGEELI